MSVEAQELQNLNSELAEVNIEIPRDGRGRISWASLRDQPERIAAIIESEAQRLLVTGNNLSQQRFLREGIPGILSGVELYYPGKLTSLQLKFGVPRAKPRGYWQDPGTILREAHSILAEEGDISVTILRRHNLTSLAVVSGGMRQLKKNLGIEEALKPAGYWTPNVISQEARGFALQHGDLSQRLLRIHGRMDLLNAISQKYPGRITKLKKDLGIKLLQKERGYWTPKRMQEEATRFFAEHGQLSGSALVSKGRSDLASAIGAKYPGGMGALKAEMHVRAGRTPSNYWTPDVIEREAQVFIDEHGALSHRLLGEHRRFDLYVAVSRKYPGGMWSLRNSLKLRQLRVPDNFWTPVKIEQEALGFYQKTGRLSVYAMHKQGKSPLAHAVDCYYLGGITALRKKLGVLLERRQGGTWTQEMIESEAFEVFLAHGKLTQKLLNSLGKGDLVNAVARIYEGGLIALQKKLGIEATIKPDGYWQIPENIEKEAREFYQNNKDLSHRALYTHRMSGLASAIARYYPGGMIGLKEKLGIATTEKPIPSEEANQELSKLLEGEI